MIGILSTWLQETMAPICMVMTANSLKTLPVELINRADERWFFDLPSLEDRIDIIKIHLRQRNQDPDNFNLVRLAEAAESMVGREIEQCLKAAMIESYEQKKFSLDENIFVSNLEHKPRIVRTMADDIKEILDWIGFDPSANDGIRARFASVPVGQDRKLKVISV
jgi:SpoVK/Ycf46/Vps4 family AAA+-type ATPase